MRFPAWVTCILFTPLLIGCSHSPPAKFISRIAFGSCCRQDKPQPIWDAIVSAQPDVFIWLGDNIYADTEDPAVMRAKYDLVASQAGYEKLRADTKILGTWDDHDMGKNDAGAEFPAKEGAKQEMLRFLNEPQDSARRKHDGVYDAHFFGPKGKRIQVILLDTRWFRSPLKSHRDEKNNLYYDPDDDASKTMLGEAQWAWLEQQLKQPADVRLIGSSIQVLSGEHRFEKWNTFPRERQRLLDLIDRTTGREPVVILSGDRHTAEISKLDRAGGLPLFDVTSSSLNAAGASALDEPNRYRVGDRYRPVNFGMIEIDWSARRPKLSLQICDVEGKPVLEAKTN
jgi:alkaline phosphatase D